MCNLRPFPFVARKSAHVLPPDVLCDPCGGRLKLFRWKHVAVESAPSAEQVAVQFKIADVDSVAHEMNLKLNVHVLHNDLGPRTREGQAPPVSEGLAARHPSFAKREPE